MNRRHILSGLLAAPMLIRTPGLLMPVRPLPFDLGLMRFKCTERWGSILVTEAFEKLMSERFLAIHQVDASPLFRLSA